MTVQREFLPNRGMAKAPSRASAIMGRRLLQAGVAQLAEHLICNQTVGGSNPLAGSMSLVSARRPVPAESNRDGAFRRFAGVTQW